MGFRKNSSGFSFSIDSLLYAIFLTAAFGVGLSYGSFYLFHLAVVVSVFVIAAHLLIKDVKLAKLNTRLHLLVLFWAVWYGLSVFWSVKPTYALQHTAYVILGFVIVLAVSYYSSSTKKLHHVVAGMIGVFFLEALVSLAEVYSFGHWPSSPKSNYVGYFGKSPSDNTWVLSGFGRNQNYVAITMAIALPFSLLCLKASWRYLIAAAFILVIIFSWSRATVIALFLMLAILPLIQRAKDIPIILAAIPLLVLVLFVGASLDGSTSQRLSSLQNATSEFLSPTVSDETGSINARKRLIQRGLAAFWDSGGIGVGAGGSLALPEVYDGAAEGAKASMHNIWVELLVDGGLGLFIIFFVWYVYISVRLLNIAHYGAEKYLRKVASACFLSIIGFLVSAVSASSTIYFFPMWILFGLAISVINIQNSYKALERHW